MLITIMKLYDPIRETEYCLLIIDILYTALGLESYFKLMPQQFLISVVEELLKTLYQLNNHSHKTRQKSDALGDSIQPVVLTKEQMKQAKKEQKRITSQSFHGELNLSTLGSQIEIDDRYFSKGNYKIAKKVISLIGFIFQSDNLFGAKFWNSQVREGYPYQNDTGNRNLKQEVDVKLIEYLVD